MRPPEANILLVVRRRKLAVGHDEGGAAVLCSDRAHSEAVRWLSILDVAIPGRGGDFSQGAILEDCKPSRQIADMILSEGLSAHTR